MSKHVLIALSALVLAACGGSSDVGPRQISGPLADIRFQGGDCSPSDNTGPVEALFYRATVEGQYLQLDGSRTEWLTINPENLTVTASGIALDTTLVVENNSTAAFGVVASGQGNINVTGSVYDEASNTHVSKTLNCSQELTYAGLDFIKVGEATTNGNGDGTIGGQDLNTLVNVPVNFSIAGSVRSENNGTDQTELPAGCLYTLTIDPSSNGTSACEVAGTGSNSTNVSSNGQPVSFQCSVPGQYPVIVSDIAVDTNANPSATEESCTPNVLGTNDNIAVNQGLLRVAEDNIDDVRGFDPVCSLRVDANNIPREGSLATADDCPTSDRTVAEPAVLLGANHAFTAIVKKPDSDTYYHVARLTDNGQDRAWDFDLFDGADETVANEITNTSNCTPFSIGYNAELGAQILTAPTFTDQLTRCQGQYVQAFLANDSSRPLVPANGPAEIVQPQIDDVRIALANSDVISGATTSIDVQCHFVGGSEFLPCGDLADFVIANWDADDASCTNVTFAQQPQGITPSFLATLVDVDQPGSCSISLTLTDNGADETDAVPVGGITSNDLNFNLVGAPVASFKILPELSCVGRTGLLQGLATGQRVRGQSSLMITDVVREVPNCSGDNCIVAGADLNAADLNWSDAGNVQPGYWNGTGCEDSVGDTGSLGELSRTLNGFVTGGINIADCNDENADQCYEATSMLRLQSYCVTATVPENLAANQDNPVVAGTTIIVLPVADDQLLDNSEALCETLDPLLANDLVGGPSLGPQLVNTLGNLVDPLLATLDTGAGFVDGGIVGTGVETLLYGVEDVFPFGLATITQQLLGPGIDPVPGLNLLAVVEVIGGCALDPLLEVISIPLDFLLGGGVTGFEPPEFQDCIDAGNNFVETFTDAFDFQ